MWLVIKDLYTNYKAKMLYAGHCPGKLIFTGHRTRKNSAPFTYKVYINSLLKVLTDHCYDISINRLSLPSPSFADDISLIALYPSFLKTFMNVCHTYENGDMKLIILKVGSSHLAKQNRYIPN